MMLGVWLPLSVGRAAMRLHAYLGSPWPLPTPWALLWAAAQATARAAPAAAAQAAVAPAAVPAAAAATAAAAAAAPSIAASALMHLADTPGTALALRLFAEMEARFRAGP